jgi:L-threonylcarbamoyladenylate synthase
MRVFDSLADKQLIEVLHTGAVGVIPTDTVYGLVCSASNHDAVSRLYALKKREQKPGTIIAGKLQQFIDLGIRARYVKAVEDYWPNPLSIVIPCGPELDYLHQGQRSLALRIPNDRELGSLLAATGALLTTSANQPGKPPATSIAEAKHYFGETVDFYVDGGLLKERAPSTIIRIIDDAIEVLREGAVHIDENGRIS